MTVFCHIKVTTRILKIYYTVALEKWPQFAIFHTNNHNKNFLQENNFGTGRLMTTQMKVFSQWKTHYTHAHTVPPVAATLQRHSVETLRTGPKGYRTTLALNRTIHRIHTPWHHRVIHVHIHVHVHVCTYSSKPD